MTGEYFQLPREVVTLVHHVELNRSGWWEKSLARLVLSTIWLGGDTQAIETIHQNFQDAFKLSISRQKLSTILLSLEEDNFLVRVSANKYRIPDTTRLVLEEEIAEVERVEESVREFFLGLAEEYCPQLEPTYLWEQFETEMLIPLVQSIGAETYKFIIGERPISNGTEVERFVAQFGVDNQEAVKALIVSFLNPKRADVRSYVTRLLHAQFCVESSGISQETIDRLNSLAGETPTFVLFLDTNFVFPLVGLDETTATASVNELKDLLKSLSGNIEINLYVTPRTIDEAKAVIRAVKSQVSGVPNTRNFTETALRLRTSGLTESFFNERQRRNGQLSAAGWFDPYIDDFLQMARKEGIEIYNGKDLDEYPSRQDVINDVDNFMDYEKKRPEIERKSYNKVLHDIVLWHLVANKRSQIVESPLEAKYWVLTLDSRLIGFDQYKLNINRANVQLCLYPATLVQLLQFWVPRTSEFEEAVLGGLRLPFLFQEFDTTDEKISLKIIEQLGGFEGRDDFTSEVLINVAMNKGLRSRIEQGKPEDDESQLIRDTLVEQLQIQERKRAEEINRLKEEREKSGAEIDKKDSEIESLKDEVASGKMTINELKAEFDAFRSEVTQKEEEESRQREAKISRHKARLGYSGWFLFSILISVAVGWYAEHFLPNFLGIANITILIPLSVALAAFLALHAVFEYAVEKNHKLQPLRGLWGYMRIRGLRRWLWGSVLVVVLIEVIKEFVVKNIYP